MVDFSSSESNYKYNLETSHFYKNPESKFWLPSFSPRIRKGCFSESHTFDYMGKTYVIRLTSLSNGNKYYTFWFDKLLLGGRHYNDDYGYHDSIVHLSPWENQGDLLQHDDFVSIIENQIESVPFK